MRIKGSNGNVSIKDLCCLLRSRAAEFETEMYKHKSNTESESMWHRHYYASMNTLLLLSIELEQCTLDDREMYTPQAKERMRLLFA